MSETDFHFTFHFSIFQYPLSQDTVTCYFSIGIIHLNRQFDTEFKFYFAMGILNFALRWEWEQIFGRLWLPDKVSGIVEWRI